tara:strand:- start:100 stop:510 length:411 start_codon:yes stop_codon:yes gene_type:complete
MLKTQMNSDKIAMSLSAACAIHCFFAPTLIIFSYGISSISIESELIHYLILLVAAPVSIFALSLGYKNHKTLGYLITGLFGLSILVFAVLFGEPLVGKTGEQFITLLGSLVVAFSHFKNYKTCQEVECSCHEDQIN